MEFNPHTNNQRPKEDKHNGAMEITEFSDAEDPQRKSTSKAEEKGTLCGLSKRMQWILAGVLFAIIVGLLIGLTIHLVKKNQKKNASLTNPCNVDQIKFDDKQLKLAHIENGNVAHNTSIDILCSDSESYTMKGDKSMKCINGGFLKQEIASSCEKNIIPVIEIKKTYNQNEKEAKEAQLQIKVEEAQIVLKNVYETALKMMESDELDDNENFYDEITNDTINKTIENYESDDNENFDDETTNYMINNCFKLANANNKEEFDENYDKTSKLFADDMSKFDFQTEESKAKLNILLQKAKQWNDCKNFFENKY